MRRVALLIETSRSYGRDLLRGVKRYSLEQGPWSLFVEVRDLESQPPSWLRNWDGDGIITRSGSTAIAAEVRRARVPTIELRSTRHGPWFPFVGVDNHEVGAMVARHFLERGFRNFGIFALNAEEFFVERRESFVASLKHAGYSCSVLLQSGRTEKPAGWETQQQRLMSWIKQLPRPVAIMACTDQLGCWLLDACSRLSVRVPEEVAIVGVENDDVLTTVSTPPLSSVRLAGEQIGFTAASLLDRLMRGERLRQRQTLIPPICLETRQSSDIVAIEDRDLAQAVQLIRERACSAFTVADILMKVPISRSTLERGFRQLLGRSPNQEIVRVKIERVCQLLRETDLNLDQISRRTGFNTPQYMLEVFRKQMRMTPGAYRRRCAATE